MDTRPAGLHTMAVPVTSREGVAQPQPATEKDWDGTPLEFDPDPVTVALIRLELAARKREVAL